MSVDQFEEAKQANQKRKYSDERTERNLDKGSYQKAMGSSRQKIESRDLKSCDSPARLPLVRK